MGEGWGWFLLLQKNQEPRRFFSAGVTGAKYLADIKWRMDDPEGHRFRYLKFLVDHD